MTFLFADKDHIRDNVDDILVKKVEASSLQEAREKLKRKYPKSEGNEVPFHEADTLIVPMFPTVDPVVAAAWRERFAGSPALDAKRRREQKKALGSRRGHDEEGGEPPSTCV